MTTAVETVGARQHRPGALARTWALVRRHTLTLFAVLALLYLLVPIAVVVIFSFNDPIGRFNFTWQGFTLKNWAHPFAYPGLGDAVRLSIEIAILSSLVATAIGTLMALALVRYQFRGGAATNLLIFLPMATPEIVMGSSLLTLFLNKGPFGVLGFQLGFVTILIAHIMFNISFVVVTVRARLAGFDRNLEEAAMDLGANEWTTFWKVTFPLILPGVIAAALLAFSLSIDDFVITNFTAGRTVTFPMFIWGAQRIGIPVQVNVIGTLIFVIAVGFVALTTVLQSRSARRTARLRPTA
jgi:spermidine/putrescine transport system permease protein